MYCTCSEIAHYYHLADDEAPVLEEAKVAVSAEKKKKRVKRLVSKMYTTEDGSLGTCSIVHVHVLV